MSGLFAFCFLRPALVFSDNRIRLCRQFETYNKMIFIDKNHFGLSRRYKATYFAAAGLRRQEGPEEE
jgi:hypothetical protein